MSGAIVCDASVLVALLVDAGPDGQWAATTLSGRRLSAPALVGFEAANIIRRLEAAGLISADQAALTREDLVTLPIDEWPYRALAERAADLRHNLTTYDAVYVALAELLDCGLATLDERIGRAPGLRCQVLSPSTG